MSDIFSLYMKNVIEGNRKIIDIDKNKLITIKEPL